MEDEMRRLELIDKYLNDELSSSEAVEFKKLRETDPDFENEFFTHVKIREGIEEVFEKEFKSRLRKYYSEYQNDNNPTGILDGKGKSGLAENPPKLNSKKVINLKIITIVSMAASLIFGVFFWLDPWSSKDEIAQTTKEVEEKNKEPERTNDSSNADLITKKPKSASEQQDPTIANVPKSTPNKELPDVIEDVKEPERIYSLNSSTKVMHTHVEKVYYNPNLLKYTFNGKQISLIGNPGLPSMQLQVFRSESGDYYIENSKDELYSVNLTKTPLILEKTEEAFVKGEKTKETVKIEIKDLLYNASLSSKLLISLEQNHVGKPTYLFEKDGHNKKLNLTGDFVIDSLKVVQLKYQGELKYFLITQQDIYELNINDTSSRPLIKGSVMESKLTRLFRHRDILSKDVYQLK